MTARPTQSLGRPNPVIAAGVMAALTGLVVWGGIAMGVYNDRAHSDQNIYHLRVIRQFADELPVPNLSDYYSATGPGYHLALAPIHRFVTHDPRALRAVSAIFTIALLAFLARDVAKRVRWPGAVLLCLPMLTSLYVFVSGAWLLPDNLAWLTVLAAMLLAFKGIGRDDRLWFVKCAVVLAAAVFVRQINLWPLGVIMAGAVLLRDGSTEADRGLAPPLMRGWEWVSLMSATVGLPALVILVWFHSMWHGLTPPAFQTVPGPLPPGHSSWQHEGPNFAVPAMVLAVLAATGFFFLGFLWSAVREMLATRRRQLVLVTLLGVAVGAAAALVVPTEYTPPPGPRYSGLWNVSAKFPVIAHRSVFMAVLAAAGGALVALVFLALNRRDRWIWLATWLCFAAAQSANAKAWHKYYEPFCLMMLALVASRLIERRGTPRWAYAGPVALAMLLAGVTLSNLTKG